MQQSKLSLRLKELRKEFNMTQADLAKQLGVVRTAVANYETDRTTPDNESLQLMSKLFNVSTDYLLGLSNEKFINNNINTQKRHSRDDCDIRRIERARGKMSDAQKEKMMKILELSFDDYFKDDDIE